ncbi:LytR/AlgR family response regulator transcription factor [Caldalkalibacillus salinus]|uniref:LytR/AlgR family response regulator transcription factor n=1 Tax=Caldalkalibacillus salinus TaxID=2803787 RepID=UPI001921BE38|nr:LytTR family DNA-binding domain-containing protein [Caldalkalibacillus salinus]
MRKNVMIAENSIQVRKDLEYKLQELPHAHLLSSVSDGQTLLEQVKQQQPDIVFLDTHLARLTGIDAARKLALYKHVPHIIFISSSRSYAVEAFELQAIDYILKPITQKRLISAWFKFLQHPPKLPHCDHAQHTTSTCLTDAPRLPRLLLEENERIKVVQPHSILYAVRDHRVVRVKTQHHVYTTKLTLQQLEEKLTAFHFFRCHRSYLVNLQHVQDIIPWFNGAYNIVLKDKTQTTIPVSRSSAKELLDYMAL